MTEQHVVVVNLQHLIIITVLFSTAVSTNQMLTIAGTFMTVIDYKMVASCMTSETAQCISAAALSRV